MNSRRSLQVACKQAVIDWSEALGTFAERSSVRTDASTVHLASLIGGFASLRCIPSACLAFDLP